MKLQILFAIAGVSFPVVPATAQNVVDAGEIVFENWSYDSLYESGAWSVDELFGRDVTGDGGEGIGDVEDLVLNDAGEVLALIAEVGGFWDIGDTHVSVPWDMVEIGEDGSVSVPVTQDNLSEFDLFASSGLPESANVATDVVEGVDDEELGPGLWRASDLMGDYVRVLSADDVWVNFGYVSDLMIEDAEIAATIVSMAGRFGQGDYAYPYRRSPGERYGIWQPPAETQDIPLLVDDVLSSPRFDEDQMQ